MKTKTLRVFPEDHAEVTRLAGEQGISTAEAMAKRLRSRQSSQIEHLPPTSLATIEGSKAIEGTNPAEPIHITFEVVQKGEHDDTLAERVIDLENALTVVAAGVFSNREGLRNVAAQTLSEGDINGGEVLETMDETFQHALIILEERGKQRLVESFRRELLELPEHAST